MSVSVSINVYPVQKLKMNWLWFMCVIIHVLLFL